MNHPCRRIGCSLFALALACTPLSGVADERPSAEDPLAFRQQRYARADGLLRYLDSNHNGQIDADEAQGSRRHYLERILQRTGVAPNFPISISQFRAGLLDYYRLSADQAPAATAPSISGSSASGATMATPTGATGAATAPGSPSLSIAAASIPTGFGAADKLAPPPGFGIGPAPATALGAGGHSTTTSSTTAGSPSSNVATSGTSTSASNIDERIRQYAEGLVRQYDANKNGVLEREEWREIRGDPQAADANQDSAITPAELANYYAQKYGRPTVSSSAASSNASQSGNHGSDSAGASRAYASADSTRSSSGAASDPRRSSETTARRGYRFLTPAERLPKGLPDWFREKDANGDGQVSMAEFARDWNDSVAREFTAFDRNGDGLLTPTETIGARPTEAGSSAGSREGRSYRDRDRDRAPR